MTPEELKVKWQIYLQDQILDSGATKQYNEFVSWCKTNTVNLRSDNAWTLNNLQLNGYANTLNNNEESKYLAYMAETATFKFGHPGGTSAKHGLYMDKKGNYRHQKNIINQPAINAKFEEIKAELSQLATGKNRNTTNIWPQMARKYAFLFNPSKYLPIYDNKIIDKLIDIFIPNENETPNDDGPFKTANLVSYFYGNEWLRQIAEGKGPAAIAVRHLQLSQFLRSKLEQNALRENTIFYGPPGTGKTHYVQERIAGQKQCFVQFHPSYSYEDFMEGLRPDVTDRGVSLTLQSGKFKQFCKEAADALKEYRKKNPSGDDYPLYFFIADEINRAELSRIFGDTLVCIEHSKRIDFDQDGKISKGLTIQTTLSHLDSKDKAVLWDDASEKAYFGIPVNIVFLGTMNDTDRSIDAFDLALRRRFKWVRMECDHGFIQSYFTNPELGQRVSHAFEKLNELVTNNWGLGESYAIGHSYITHLDRDSRSNASLSSLFDDHIAPLLKEYLRSHYSEAETRSKLKDAKEVFT